MTGAAPASVRQGIAVRVGQPARQRRPRPTLRPMSVSARPQTGATAVARADRTRHITQGASPALTDSSCVRNRVLTRRRRPDGMLDRRHCSLCRAAGSGADAALVASAPGRRLGSAARLGMTGATASRTHAASRATRSRRTAGRPMTSRTARRRRGAAHDRRGLPRRDPARPRRADARAGSCSSARRQARALDTRIVGRATATSPCSRALPAAGALRPRSARSCASGIATAMPTISLPPRASGRCSTATRCSFSIR